MKPHQRNPKIKRITPEQAEGSDKDSAIVLPPAPSRPSPLDHLLQRRRRVPRGVNEDMLALRQHPRRCHPFVYLPSCVRPGLRVQPRLPVSETLPDHIIRCHNRCDGQRDSELPSDGVQGAPVPLCQVGGVEQHRVALRHELMDQTVAGTKNAAVLFRGVLGLPNQRLAQPVRLNDNERNAGGDSSRKGRLAGPGQARKQQQPGVAGTNIEGADIGKQNRAQPVQVGRHTGNSGLGFQLHPAARLLGRVRGPVRRVLALRRHAEALPTIRLGLQHRRR